MRKTLAATGAVAVVVLGANASHTQPGLALTASLPPILPIAGCSKTFTVAMVRRAADVTYGGTADVRMSSRRMLGRMVRCLRDPSKRPYIRAYIARDRAAWVARRDPPCSSQLASWYDDAGATASGFHAYYGVANKSLAFGSTVRFSYGGHQVTATVDDRGPYVGGRIWDLNQNTAQALGFDGVDSVCASPAAPY
jgi:rare lipoprotein A